MIWVGVLDYNYHPVFFFLFIFFWESDHVINHYNQLSFLLGVVQTAPVDWRWPSSLHSWNTPLPPPLLPWYTGLQQHGGAGRKITYTWTGCVRDTCNCSFAVCFVIYGSAHSSLCAAVVVHVLILDNDFLFLQDCYEE